MSITARLAATIVSGATLLMPFVAAATTSDVNPAVTAPADAEQKDKSLACSEFKPRQSAASIQDFLGNPAKLLSDNPTGGIGLVNSSRNLAGSDLAAAKALIDLASKANEMQQAAIAAGLSNAAATCAATAPQYGEAIARMVAESQTAGLVAAYLRADAQNATASTTSAAGGYAGGGSTDGEATQLSAANGYAPNGDNPIDVTSGAYDIGGGGNAVIDSVSPSQ